MKITCPQKTCRAENEATSEACLHCKTPLRGYVKLLSHHAHLFNQGLDHANRGEYEQARDLFAAVIYWCPTDLEARNALARTYFKLEYPDLAKQHWTIVYENTAQTTLAHTLAKCGLDEIASYQEANRKPKSSKWHSTLLGMNGQPMIVVSKGGKSRFHKKK